MAEGHIVLENVRKSFGPKHVLNGVNVAVQKGHSLVVIGGSGTGKSVMLKCILGLLQPDSGSIKIAGEEVVGLKGKARDAYLSRFGMLFQGAALFDSLPVWVGQVSRDIGVRFTTRAWNLTTHRIDPDVDEARDYVIEDLVLAGRVAAAGYVGGVGERPRDAPARNLTGDPYYTDGDRAVILLSPTRVE